MVYLIIFASFSKIAYKYFCYIIEFFQCYFPVKNLLFEKLQMKLTPSISNKLVLVAQLNEKSQFHTQKNI